MRFWIALGLAAIYDAGQQPAVAAACAILALLCLVWSWLSEGAR